MDLSNKTICIAGIGGVGGYIGGVLARTYANVNFLARGERLAHIREYGLTVKCANLGIFTVNPKAVSDSITDFGHLDCLFICCKNYQLPELCAQLKDAVSTDTIIVPIMNGTTAAGEIRKAFGKGIVLDALIYIISTAMPDFSIESLSPSPLVQLGKQNADAAEREASLAVGKLLNDAGIKCKVEEDIEAAVWTKYIQNCAFNVATAYYLTDAQGIYNDPARLEKYRHLLEESCLVARTLGIHIADNLEDDLYDRLLHRTVANGTSSLKKDMAAGRPNELETFSGTLVRKAKELGLLAPVSEEFYEGMKNR
ncbi:MAG: 2-dehydropantoate 2-reductase [Lachnospiraceae bacterium]|nr:2-dehydropantoate 2-reductase [Lachnospiraceae bacterium]